jgi:hypothetical protein
MRNELELSIWRGSSQANLVVFKKGLGMDIFLGSRRTALTLIAAVGALSISSAALAQTAPPPQDYQQPPPGYQQQPPPGYQQQQPPPGYQQQQPPPGYQQGQPPPAAYAPPPGYAPAYAPPAPQHSGFYMRLHLGGGYAHMGGTDANGDEQAFVGGGGSFGIALGGTIAPNLVIFGNLFGMFLSDPDVEFNGTKTGSVTGTTTISGIGPGVAYYFQPINLYISGTLAFTQFQAADSNGNTVFESNTGYGFQGMVGKEWWVSQTWGIGIAGEILYAGGMKDKNDSTIKWAGTTFSLAFSATYN